MRNIRKIHFINRIDHENAGDWNCSPLEYYYWYFKQYNIIRHDIGSIDFNEIDKDDVVIIGGGGLFNVLESFNLAINSVVSLCDNVISWGVGFNTHNERFQMDTEFTPIDLKRFRLISIRDYNHPSGIDYVPCPSVKALCIQKDRKPIRKYGVIFHRNMPEISKLPFDSISNNESITRINEFILESEIIVTNTYHCAYWATLLERKVVIINGFSSKFDHLKYKPEFVEGSLDDISGMISLIESAAPKAEIYRGTLEEAENINDSFFEKVRGIIENLRFPNSNDYQNTYLLNISKDIRFSNLQGEVQVLNNSLTWLYDKIDKIVQLEQSCIVKEQNLERKYLDLQMNTVKQKIISLTKGKKVAFAGAGEHTLRLLDLLNGEVEIGCIVAKEHKYCFEGIPQLTYDQLPEQRVDVVVISSFEYRNDIRAELQNLPARTEVIDIYSELKKDGLSLVREFWVI